MPNAPCTCAEHLRPLSVLSWTSGLPGSSSHAGSQAWALLTQYPASSCPTCPASSAGSAGGGWQAHTQPSTRPGGPAELRASGKPQRAVASGSALRPACIPEGTFGQTLSKVLEGSHCPSNTTAPTPPSSPGLSIRVSIQEICLSSPGNLALAREHPRL